MNSDEYRAAIALARKRNISISHAEGSEWKNHKYIKKIGNRYIYAEDLDKGRGNAQVENNKDHFNAMARVAGNRNGMIRNDKDASRVAGTMNAISNELKVEAAKEYTNDLTDALAETCTNWLKGQDAEIDIDECLDELAEKKGVELDREKRAEIAKMAVTQLIRRMDEELEDNEKRKNPTSYDPGRLKEWSDARGELMSAFKTNTPYADRTAEVKDFEKKQRGNRFSHSFDSEEEFYAAVEKSKAELRHFGIKGQKHGFRRFQNEDGSLTAAGRDRYGVGNGIRTKSEIEIKSAKGLNKIVSSKPNFNQSNRKIAYHEGVKAIGSALLSAAVVATAAKNGKNIVANVKNKRYFKAAFDATKLAGKVFVGANLVANAVGHARNVGMALGTEKARNDKAVTEGRENAYRYKSANAKAESSSAKARDQKVLTDASYQALGRGFLSRAIAARKNVSPEAQEYNANRSKLLGMEAQATIDRSRADEIKRKSGRNKLEREYNTAKYGR